LSGVNTWAGPITLNGIGSSVGSNLNQIGATAGTLLLSGVIQNGGGSSWGKTGNGDVVLTGASPNTYTNQTLVFGGRLIVEKDGALGQSASDVNASGNTFLLNGGTATIAFRAPGASPGINYTTNEWINLDGAGNGVLGQLDNLGGDNSFTGKIGLGGPTLSGEVTSSIGVSAGSLHLSGPIFTKGASGARTLNKIGSGRLILSGNSGVVPTNTLNGQLQNSKINVNAGTVELRSPSATVANLPGVTTWNVNLGSTVEISSGLWQTGTLNVDNFGTARITNGSNTIRTNTLNITAGGKVDVRRGKVIVDWTGSSPIGSWDGAQYTGLIGQVQSGRGDGTWNGGGILTSETDATTSMLTTLAIAEASDVLGLGATDTDVWRGQTVDGSSTLVAYTWGGDADLNGELNGDDYFLIDSHVLQSGSVFGYPNGDFDYNGEINGDDYFILDSNILQTQASPPFPTGAGGSGFAPIPEPSTIGVLAALAFSARRFRKPSPSSRLR
jgi:autotransporter-associated beta strand protein